MAKLTIGDLQKPYHNGEFPFKCRAMRFLQMYQNGIPFEMEDGRKAIVKGDAGPNSDFLNKIERTASGDVVSLSNRDKVFVQYEDGEEKAVSLNNFKKTEENFGGKEGKHASTTVTAEEEQLTCDACNLAFQENRELTDEDIQELAGQSDLLDKSWVETVKKTVNGLFRSGLVCVKGKVSFYKNETSLKALAKNNPVSIVLATFKRLFDKGETGGFTFAKWTPADIWAVSSEFTGDVLDDLRSVETLDDLTEWMRTNRDLIIGISLKKVGAGEASVESVNSGREEKKGSDSVSVFGYEVVWVAKGNTTLSLRWDHDIFPGISKMDFRCFNNCTNYAGEFLGKTARNGKVSHSTINMYLKNLGYLEYLLPPCAALRDSFFSGNPNRDKRYLRELEEIARKRGLNLEEIARTKWIDLYLGTKIARFIEEGNDSDVLAFLERITRCASSRSEQCCVHLKVS